jgi:hypothetical protein
VFGLERECQLQGGFLLAAIVRITILVIIDRFWNDNVEKETVLILSIIRCNKLWKLDVLWWRLDPLCIAQVYQRVGVILHIRKSFLDPVWCILVADGVERSIVEGWLLSDLWWIW